MLIRAWMYGYHMTLDYGKQQQLNVLTAFEINYNEI